MVLSPKWTDTIDRALNDPRWDEYDPVIKKEVAQYTSRFNLKIDWKILKAQLWTESGGRDAWETRPMQIAVPTDLGYPVLKKGAENSSIIMSDQLKQDLKRDRPTDDPEYNIQLGIAYVYTKLSRFESVVLDQNKLTYKAKRGDTAIGIHGKLGTTVQNIEQLNPGSSKMIRENQILIYQKAAIQPISINLTPVSLQNYYNGGNDTNYAEKVQYCIGVISRLNRK